MRPVILAVPLLLALSLPALAQESNAIAPAPSGSEWFQLEWRVRGVGVTAYPLDAAGDNLHQDGYAEHRLRASGFLKNGPVSITAEVDAANGVIAGDRSPRFPYLDYRRDAYGGFDVPSSATVRQLWAEAKSDFGILRVGQMTSKWGLGIVANDGAGTPDWGDHYYGDIVDRALFATRPLSPLSSSLAPLVVALGGDVVYKDQTADLTRGDGAFQGVLSLVWVPEGSGNRAGVYAVHRTQTDRDGFRLRANVLDAHARWQSQPGGMNRTWHAEGEIARVFGTTDEVRDIYTPTEKIDQLGVATELGFGIGGNGRSLPRIEGVLQAGYASGDAKDADGRLNTFTFDPEYRVGFILFDEVLAYQTAQSAREVSDPGLFGRPAPGARFLPTLGGVSNAIFVMPTVRVQPFGHQRVMSKLTVRAGVLIAKADKPLDDAYQTNAVHGGVRHTYLGSTTSSRDLGTEADLGLRWNDELGSDRHRWSADLQVGRFFPGGAFAWPDGTRMNPVDRILGGVTLTY